MKSLYLALGLLAAAPAAMAQLPFDLGLPTLEEIFRTFPKIGEGLVQIDMSKEKYSVGRSLGENPTKPPQLFSSPIIIPAGWPRDLSKTPVDVSYTFTVGSDGIPQGIKRVAPEIHRDLERIANIYLSKLRYSPAELSGGAIPCTAEVVLRFQVESDEMK